MMLKWIVLGTWALLMLLAALGGRVKLYDRVLSPLVGLVVGPVIAVVMGTLFLVVGAMLSVPVWIWFIPIP